jgi:hypothetical protein
MPNRRPALFAALFVLVLIGSNPQVAEASPSVRPVDPQASPMAQRLLDYLARPHPIISGQAVGLLDG